MFDLTACTRTIENKIPVHKEWWQLQWLNRPLLFALLIILAVFGIRWLLQDPQRIRWLKSPKGLLCLFSASAILPLFLLGVTQGLVAFVPPDTGQKADAIVVLGRGWPLLFSRVDAAAELWQAKRAPIIFASGIDDAPNLMQLLAEKGIPQQALDGENCSLTTEENAIFSAAILQPQGVRRILLVTDSHHMLRSLMVFRAYGFDVIPHKSAVPQDWNPKERGFLKLREYGGILNYSFRGLFTQRRFSEVDDPELATLLQKAEQYGKQKLLRR